MISKALGSREAMLAGVLMIPAPMELPRQTAIPKPTPSTRRSAALGVGVVSRGICAAHNTEQRAGTFLGSPRHRGALYCVSLYLTTRCFRPSAAMMRVGGGALNPVIELT